MEPENDPARRDTRQRALVYEIVAASLEHPTAEWVYARARRRIPRISLGTVYRNLQVLAREGRIRALDAWGKTTRYDADLSAHHHFVCTGCGAIRDVPKPPEEDERLRQLFAIPDFTITGHRLEFEGRCAHCSSPRKREKARPAESKREKRSTPCPH
jgi:Fe2+ or Zn2+ uptake regulation protein